MMQVLWVDLPGWVMWVVTGTQAVDFLHNLMTQDVRSLGAGEVRYGLFLTPRGKVVADAWVTSADDGLRLFAPDAWTATLDRHLSLYRLRTDVRWDVRPVRAGWRFRPAASAGTVPTLPGWTVSIPWEDGAADLIWTDEAEMPRWDPSVEVRSMSLDEWHRWRRTVGWVWPWVDLAGEEWMPLEVGFHHALSYTKGCYIGQEVVAKATYLGRPPRRLFQVLGTEPWTEPPEGGVVGWRGEPRKTFGWGPGRDPFVWVGWTWVPYAEVSEPVGAELRLPDGSTRPVTLRVPPWLAAVQAMYPLPSKPEKSPREVRDRGR
jgi:folate-binding protein YgfZ